MRLFPAALATVVLYAQVPQATVKVEVVSQNGPVQAAEVTLNDRKVQTGVDGVATVAIPLGPLRVTVSRAGFLPASTTLDVDAPKE